MLFAWVAVIHQDSFDVLTILTNLFHVLGSLLQIPSKCIRFSYLTLTRRIKSSKAIQSQKEIIIFAAFGFSRWRIEQCIHPTTNGASSYVETAILLSEITWGTYQFQSSKPNYNKEHGQYSRHIYKRSVCYLRTRTHITLFIHCYP